MSRKRKPVLLGPDGRPYVPPPKPRPVEAAGEETTTAYRERTWSFSLPASGENNIFRSILRVGYSSAASPALAEAVAEQVGALIEGFDGVGGEELPRQPADLTAYADAFRAAQKACTHPDYEDVVYAKREAFCPDCRQYFKRPRGIFG